jgi:DNA invertase Pin-like site-specific DNA recombinase
MKYGYARVSNTTQDYAAQVDVLKAAGCERIFSEKQSGKNGDGRPEFGKLMKALLPGDVVVVAKLDRLARSSQGAASELLRKGLKRADSDVAQYRWRVGKPLSGLPEPWGKVV